jgi:hypothetical protein
VTAAPLDPGEGVSADVDGTTARGGVTVAARAGAVKEGAAAPAVSSVFGRGSLTTPRAREIAGLARPPKVIVLRPL